MLQGGAFAVDVFLLLSGLLLALKFVDVQRGDDSLGLRGVAAWAVRRACRLWPVLLLLALVQLAVLTESHAGVWPAVHMLAFVGNETRSNVSLTLVVVGRCRLPVSKPVLKAPLWFQRLKV